ncbi:CTP-dependent riboflavin kinase [Methanococcus voltae]|uniref:Riboflavin kinase n=2 Tax=Methanococcus voltae TaxID=2188 RepID=A0A8J7RMW0_METVO|nr:CTP-dependent riboflavin kinase [Methanococcus voltae]MBP2172774.1 riboflavin kinase [Methanococcus voltae]MBP2201816.1 riboflavin kinase [Methanococcus voltae]MCS3922640.1 riboflavin kinase [Methanococcus voltae PS]
MKFYGKVISGKGKGKYFVGLEPYKLAFEKNLGYTPYLGTLNIKTGRDFWINVENYKIIDDFEYKNEKYYGVKFVPITIKNRFGVSIKGSIVAPKKTVHSKSILEIISPLNLRRYLNLKNNDIVIVELEV